MNVSTNYISAKSSDKSLEQCVADLPEMYQPIFGHPELSSRVSRQCEDRLSAIVGVYRALETKLGRSLRVLDLGCAQGYFSLHLAELGASVVGVDFQSLNIDVCNALLAEHEAYDVHFRVGLIEETIAETQKGQFDLVLGLSVFHHIVHRLGVEPVIKILGELAQKVTIGVFEMALSNEPPDWALSQPRKPRDLLRDYAFVHELARHATHLSRIERPLFFASDECWFLGNGIEFFTSWSTQSHCFANNAFRGTRRYYFASERMVKMFMLNDDDVNLRMANLHEYVNETSFLNNCPTNYPTPNLIAHDCLADEAWLTREKWQGELLLTLMQAGKSYNSQTVLFDVLDQLVALEATGLYHNDVRAWNVLIAPNGRATLIDFGGISIEKKDCDWPYNLFLSLMIFIRELLSGAPLPPDPIRAPSFNPNGFPEPYNYVFFKLYEREPRDWSFSYLRDLFVQALERKETIQIAAPSPSSLLALLATEDAYGIKVYGGRSRLASA